MGRSNGPQRGRQGVDDGGMASAQQNSGGVDISKILQVPKQTDNPPNPTAIKRSNNKGNRRKKKEPKEEDKVAIHGRGGDGKPIPMVIKKKKNEGSEDKVAMHGRGGGGGKPAIPMVIQKKKKNEGSEDKVVILSRGGGGGKPAIPMVIQKKKKNEGSDDKVAIHGRGGGGGKPAIPMVIQKKKKNEGSEDKVVILSRGGGKPVIHTKKKNEGSAKGAQRDSIESLKQQLFEATRDLDKERNTREMLENKVKSISIELKNVKEKMGEDKNYCVSSLKEELEFEQKCRISVQNDLSKSNELVLSEQNKFKALEKEIESEKKANDSIKRELHAAKEELKLVRASQQPMQTELSLAKQKTQDLQKRLQYEAAANVAVRMELQSIKGRGARKDELERGLRVETQITGIDVAKYTAIRMELQAAKEKIQEMKHIQTVLKQEKRSAKATHSKTEEQLLALKYNNDEYERDQLVRSLRRELHETREKLKNERKKAQPTRKKCGPKPSLFDWVDMQDIQVAPTRNGQHGGLIPILQPTSSTNMPRPIETSLPGSSAAASPPLETSLPDSSPPPSVPPSLFHFEEDDVSVVGDKALEQLHDELTFIKSAYDPDEIVFEANKVTHLIELTTGYDSEVITLALTVIIPSGYPTSGVLAVKASIQDSICPHQVRKCALDALPKLEELCMWEAQANEGREAIHPIFSVAGGWANIDWYNILSKKLDRSEESNDATVDICVSLIHAHHIVEPDRIQSFKKNASKLSLGGFIKIGKPGLILVEGTEADCDQMMEALAQFMKNKQKIFHATTFKVGGKAIRQVTDIDSCRCLPRKMEDLEGKNGMDELISSCEKLGLLQALNEIISH